jgi:hypothetical protein
MRVVTDGPVVVCNLVPGVSEYGRDAEQERDVKAVQRIDSKQEGKPNSKLTVRRKMMASHLEHPPALP